jgi:hypothetical protein
MTVDEWDACDDPATLLEAVRERASDRKLRLFACECCRQLWHLLPDDADRHAVDVAERVAEGVASNAERKAALRAATGMAYFALMADIGQAVNGVRVHAGLGIVRPIASPGDVQTWQAAPELLYTPHRELLRDIFGNPFRPVAFDPAWRTSTAVALAKGIYADRAFDRLPILADALQDAGCENADVLDHCRGLGPHARGCWVVDLVLGKA